jgi:hypothetical protein
MVTPEQAHLTKYFKISNDRKIINNNTYYTDVFLTVSRMPGHVISTQLDYRPSGN